MAIRDRDRPGPGQGHCSTYRPTSGHFQVGYTDSAQSWNLPSVIGKLRLSHFVYMAIHLVVGFPCCYVHSVQLNSTNEHRLDRSHMRYDCQPTRRRYTLFQYEYAIHCNKQYLATHETKAILRDLPSSGKKSRFLNP